MTNNRPPIVRGPTDGDRIYAGGDLYRYLAVESETDGTYGLLEAIVPPGGGPPPHLHRNEEEGFYVIEGHITVYVDGQEVEATAGAFVNMPKGSNHRFRNNTDQNAKMLILLAPGGMEAMFKETGQTVIDPTAPIPPLDEAEKERIIAVAPKYGIEVQKPPH